MYFTMKIDLHQ